MSLFSALTVAVGGLTAQSDAIGNISDDLSNSQTTGFKSIDTNFESLVTQSSSTVNDPGGVRATPSYNNDVQGNLVQSSSSTSLAISGAGFFPVRPAVVAADGTSTFSNTTYYTRSGDFSLNKDGYLVNSSGYYLTGYSVSSTGDVDTSQSLPIQLSALLDNPVKTSTASYSANLPASVSSTVATTFSSAPSTIQVYDSLGAQHNMSFTWTKQPSDADLSAQATVQTNCLTLSSQSEGTFGNGVSLSLSAGTASGYKATISVPGQADEVYDNISGTGNAFWTNLATAINTTGGAASTAIAGDIAFTAKSTGPAGNNISVSIANAASKTAGDYDVTVSNGTTSEVYTDVSGSGATFWSNLTTAITSKPSALVTATALGGADAPTVTSYSLAGGTNPSRLVTATAGSGTDAPITGTPTTLSGGTGSNVDWAASASAGTNGASFTALNTGTAGNNISVSFAAGSTSGLKATVTDGTTTETYDNISNSGTATQFWTNLTNAINNKPSALIIANEGTTAATIPTAGKSYSLSGGETPLPSSNVWMLNVDVPGGGGVDAQTGAAKDYTATIPFIFNSATSGTTAAGTIETISPPTGTGAAGSYTATTSGLAQLDLPLDFSGSGAQGAQNVTVNFGTFGSSSNGLTQFADTNVSVSSFDQNGIPRGSFQSLAIDKNGFVTLNYDNGQNRTIAQIPVVQFFAQDQLQRISGSAYAATLESGNARYSAPGSNGAGSIVDNSLESSNVDIATQFSNLIVAQQAYSANAKIVTTADQLLQTTLTMKQ